MSKQVGSGGKASRSRVRRQDAEALTPAPPVTRKSRATPKTKSAAGPPVGVPQLNAVAPPRTLAEVQARIRAFRDARDWRQFHNPKNLAASIVIEAAELLELFQWADMAEAEQISVTRRDEIAAEMADVAMYLFELADNLGIELLDAIHQKMQHNEARYPVAKAKGSSKKYNRL